MTATEMENMFDVLYNNITSNLAPGLNAYEKSLFLTKAQNEIWKNYFNPKSKGNNLQEGFDGNAKRQIDFSMLTKVYKLTSGLGNAVFDTRSNSKSIALPKDMAMAINETVSVKRGTDTQETLLQVIPIKFDEYSRLMSKPYKRPLKYQAWRLINYESSNKADIVVGPSDTIVSYTLRYVKRPAPIIVSNLDGLTIEGKGSSSLDCELDPILHEEIVQRAVELAKVAWTITGQDNVQLVMQAGQRSE